MLLFSCLRVNCVCVCQRSCFLQVEPVCQEARGGQEASLYFDTFPVPSIRVTGGLGEA